MALSTSSRIFIKNLPSTLSADDFRKHFSHYAPITDAKLLPRRRIGYVGYRNDADATKAVTYFNKSFMGMARLIVELARPVKEEEPRERKRARHLGSKDRNEHNRSPSAQEQKSGSDLPTRQDASSRRGKNSKLDDFLRVMQAPSQSRIWENQDAISDPAATRAASAAEEKPMTEADGDEEYQHVPKKARKEKSGIVDSETNLLSPPKTPMEASVEEKKKPDTESKPQSQVLDQEPTATSDADWRRSRTSSLLGLLDDEEMDEEATSDSATPKVINNDNPAQSLEPQVQSETSSQPAKEAQQENRKSGPNRAEHAEMIGNGRLFIRNLAYTCSSDDLRHHFESHGYQDLEEVSLFGRQTFPPLLFDEFNDRDSLCIANDVHQKSILVDASSF